MLNIPIEVQDALREGALRKNYKIKVNDVDPDTGERTYLYTIDNDTLVSESVKIDERMVTGKVLKFGLCEGSSLEFQYFDHPNINGKDVQVYCSVEYVDGNGDLDWYDIPMGWYTVDQCPMQWDTGIYKVTAYNKLKSDYLDNKANNQVLENFTSNITQLTLYDIRRNLLEDYEIFESHEGMTPIVYGQQIPSASIQVSGLNFSALYGIDSPLSAKDYESGMGSMPTLSTSIGFTLYSNQYPYRDPSPIPTGLTGDFYEIDFTHGKIADFEKLFYQYPCTVFDNAKLKKNGNILSGEEVVDLICASGNMADILGVTLEYTKGMNIRRLKYSTIQWDYEEKNNIAHTVEGTISDCFNRLIIRDKSQNESLVVYANLPAAILKSWYKNIDFEYYEGANEYSYYTNSSYTQYEEKVYDGLTYSNGDNYKYSAEDNILFYCMDDYVSNADMIEITPTSVPDFTLREITSAVYETVCQYGQLDRETDLFTGVELNQGGLYPADDLYPDNALYPSGNMEHPFPSTYSKLWTDTVGEQSFRYLIITYKAIENGQEVEKKLQRTVNEHGTTNYNMSDNWLFRNLVWTAEDVGAYADAMVLKMKDIRWFPFEMWCAGLPYVETGDAIEITDKNGDTHTSYVLTRTLEGIHNLQDTFINGELDIF